MNPLGGSIPQPEDPRLLAAAHGAAAISWRVVPYYAARYGERGWQFTLADSGWMTTLPSFGSAQALRQIKWVTRVLSNRGMPGWLTEQHLRILVHQLNRHAPEDAALWQILDDAREVLASERAQAIPHDAFEARAREFAAQVGMPDVPLAVGSGRILLAASADQRGGVKGAVRSTLPWFTDEARFPPTWRRAARALVRSSAVLHLA